MVLHVRESASSAQDLRTVAIPASEIKDNEWQRFSFEPIENGAGKTFYIGITSNSPAGKAVTVRYIDEDLAPGQMALRRKPLQAGQSMADFVKMGDLAYRLPK